MHRKKLLFALALVMSLAVVGAALAYWTDALSIAGTVNTGEVDVSFTNAFTNDDGVVNYVNDEAIDPNDDGTDPGLDRDVASKTAVISENGKTVTFTIENGYPGYNANGYAVIKNDGTIPVKVTGITVAEPDADEDEISELDVTVSGIAVGDVIEPNDEVLVTTNQTVTQDAEEGREYTYTVTINFAQWNAPQQPQ